MNKNLALLFFLWSLISSPVSHAHPGGQNADGCHTNKKTGEYHCHTSKAQPSVKAQEAHKELPAAEIKPNAALSTPKDKVLQLDYEGFKRLSKSSHAFKVPLPKEDTKPFASYTCRLLARCLPFGLIAPKEDQ